MTDILGRRAHPALYTKSTLNDVDGNDYDCCYYVPKSLRGSRIHIHAKTITRLLNLVFPNSHSTF